MLIINRRDQEKLKIFVNDIEFTMIVALEKNSVKLIFDAPQVVKIWRTELLTEGKKPDDRITVATTGL